MGAICCCHSRPQDYDNLRPTAEPDDRASESSKSLTEEKAHVQSVSWDPNAISLLLAEQNRLIFDPLGTGRNEYSIDDIESATQAGIYMVYEDFAFTRARTVIETSKTIIEKRRDLSPSAVYVSSVISNIDVHVNTLRRSFHIYLVKVGREHPITTNIQEIIELYYGMDRLVRDQNKLRELAATRQRAVFGPELLSERELFQPEIQFLFMAHLTMHRVGRAIPKFLHPPRDV